MIRLIQDKRPHHGYVDVFINPADVSTVGDIMGEQYTANRAYVSMRNGQTFWVTDYASVVSDKINAALAEKRDPIFGAAPKMP